MLISVTVQRAIRPFVGVLPHPERILVTYRNYAFANTAIDLETSCIMCITWETITTNYLIQNNLIFT